MEAKAPILTVPEGATVSSTDDAPLGTLRDCGNDALLLQRGRFATGYRFLPRWSLDYVDEAGVHLKLTKRAAGAIAAEEWPPAKEPQARYWPRDRYATGRTGRPAMA